MMECKVAIYRFYHNKKGGDSALAKNTKVTNKHSIHNARIRFFLSSLFYLLPDSFAVYAVVYVVDVSSFVDVRHGKSLPILGHL
jgi:hypothetical protein